MKKLILLSSIIGLLATSCKKSEKVDQTKIECNNNDAYKFGQDLAFSAKLSANYSFDRAYSAREEMSYGAAMPYQRNDECVKKGFEEALK